MEEIVKESIYIGAVQDDPVLGLLLSLTMKEINTGRHLFPNPLEEPVFYARYIKPWVIETLEKRRKMREPKQ